MAEKTKANIGFEKQIWDAACVLWGHIPAAEYRKVIIGLIFLRYISAAFEARMALKMIRMHMRKIIFSLFLKKPGGKPFLPLPIRQKLVK